MKRKFGNSNHRVQKSYAAQQAEDGQTRRHPYGLKLLDKAFMCKKMIVFEKVLCAK